MDILLVGTPQGTQIRPNTVHGMLWLQTHFEDKVWEVIALNQAIVPNVEAQMLSEDAQEAGLKLEFLPEFSISKNS